jgi:hypothetical protein
VSRPRAPVQLNAIITLRQEFCFDRICLVCSELPLRGNGEELPAADLKPTGIAPRLRDAGLEASIAGVIKLPEPDIQAA